MIEDRDQGVVFISDNGVGMDADHVQRAFDPFFTTSQVGQGLGLGLSISHSIIMNHHGFICLDSKPGRGTCVTMSLPLVTHARPRIQP